jgi:hypothetical protein
MRRLNDPDFTLRVRSDDIESLRKAIHSSSWVIFMGLILSAVILGLLLR